MKSATIKKTICIILSFMIYCTTTAAAYEPTDLGLEEEITPRYVELLATSVSLSIDMSGMATCGCDVTTRHPGSTVKVKMELQKNSSTWRTIKTWNQTDTTPCSIIKSYAVMSGYDYRLLVTVTVYDGYGNEVESGVLTSRTVHY